jgi:hypothetical protein
MRGSCHCGTVTYEVDRFATSFGHCHCITCRKTHAAAYVTTARVARESFRILSGEERLSGYESSPGKIRRFCSVCGCHIVADRAGQPYVILRTATLDDDPGVRPKVHIWRAHDVPWLIDDPDARSYDEAPPVR